MTRDIHVGVALAAGRLVAVPDDGAAWTRALTPTEDGAPPDLADALTELRDVLGAGARAARRLHVALLPPLAQLRRIDLPGLRADEVRRVLRREPSRHLPIEAALPLALAVEGTGWRGSSPFTVLAAPRALVEGIDAAARRSGWRVAEIVSAESAWAAAAASLLPRERGTGAAIVACLEDRVEVLRVRGGRAIALRRLPAPVPEAGTLVARALLGEGETAPPPTAVIGEGALAAELRASLSAPPRAPDDDLPDESPAVLAARFAPRAAGPALLAEEEHEARAAGARRRAVVRLAAAGAMLVATAVVQLWGVSRDRASVAGERARLRGPVARALATRDSLALATERLAMLRATSAATPRWSALLAALAIELPEDAYVVSLGAAGDTLRLEGAATRAAPVFDALARLPGVTAIHPERAIRQEVDEDGETTEHFVLAARLRRAP